MDTIEPKKRTRVRAYPAEFKARLVAECEQAGASVAQVALAHGLNANMLHSWRRQVRGAAGSAVASTPPAFVSLPVPEPLPTAASVIRIELRRGATSVAVAWPTEAADACAAWLRELLR
jgi:transposase